MQSKPGIGTGSGTGTATATEYRGFAVWKLSIGHKQYTRKDLDNPRIRKQLLKDAQEQQTRRMRGQAQAQLLTMLTGKLHVSI